MGFFLWLLAFLPAVPTAGQAETIAKSIAELSSVRFTVREQATKELMAFGSMAKPALRKAVESLDTETTERAGFALSRIVEAEVASLQPLPCVDAIWYDTKRRSYTLSPDPDALRRLNEIGRDCRPYRNYRQAMDAIVREKLTAGVPVKVLRMWLAELHRRDAVFFGSPSDPLAVDWREYLRK